MLTIVLTILKVIGIALLCVLGLALFIVLLVLFVPVRYEVKADIRPPGEEKEALAARVDARAGFSWLLHLVRGVFDYPIAADGVFRVFVAFFRIFPRKEKERKERTRRKRARGGAAEASPKTDRRETSAETDHAPASDAAPLETDGKDAGEAAASAQGAREEEREAAGADAGAEEAPRKRKRGERESFRGRLGRIRQSLSDLAEKPQIAAKKIYYTISCTYVKIKKIGVTLESETWARAKRLVYRQARRAVRALLPRGCRIRLVYGADDPKRTADMLARLGMLYPILEDRVQVAPSFEEETLYGTVRVRGRIIPAVFVFIFLRCFFSRDIRRLVKRFRDIRDYKGDGHRAKTRGQAE